MTARRGGRGRSGRPTIHTVAEAAGVGVGTVSRVLNNHPSVRGETRERVLAVIEELNYHPTPQARRTPLSEHRQIGVLISDLYSAWESRVMLGVDTALSGQEFGVMALVPGTAQHAEQLLQSEHFNQLVQGLLLCSDVAYAGWAAQGRTLPAVRLGAPTEDTDYVAIDNRHGGLLAGEYAATLPGDIVGVWLKDEQVAPARRNTRKGFAEAVEGAGRRVSQEVEVDIGDHPHRIASEVLERLPAGATVVTAGDWLAVALIAEAQARGLTVGEDLRVIGYGDHPQATLVGLTTVHQPLEDMAQQGTELLLQRIQERQEGRPARAQQVRLLTPRLALRGSA